VREEHRLRVFENRVLRNISGPKREWGNMGIGKTTWQETLWSLLLTKYSGDHIKQNEMCRACSMYGEQQQKCIQAFGGETW
jgi:hypothetical protein